MTMVDRGHGGSRPGPPRPSSTIADKKLRLAFSQKCADVAGEIFEFKLANFRNEALPLETRDRAANWIIDRAFGRVPQPVETSGGTSDLVRHIYEIKWLPSEPADHSKVIDAKEGASDGDDRDIRGSDGAATADGTD